MAARAPRPGGPGLERSITLTDAVVAIAMTLLILPVVDAVRQIDLFDASSLWRESRRLLSTFVISFVVIYKFWQAHGTLWRRPQDAGLEEVHGLGVANMIWLLLIAFVPFPTALVGQRVTPVTAPLYNITMLALSATTFAMSVIVNRAVGRSDRLAWLTTAVFGVCTVVSFFNPSLSLYLLLLLFITGRVEDRVAGRDRAVPSAD